MENIKQIFDVALVVLSVAVILGGGLALFKGSYNKARIQALKEDSAMCDAKILRLEQRETLLEAKVESLERENDYLEALNSQAANFITISHKVDQVLLILGSIK